jgi:hypothetical protein
MIEKCSLSQHFNMSEYLRAFKMLAPITGIQEGMPDDMVIYTANCAFIECCERLCKSGSAKKEGGMWVILTSEKNQLVHMNVLPIAIYSGANIVFVDSF